MYLGLRYLKTNKQFKARGMYCGTKISEDKQTIVFVFRYVSGTKISEDKQTIVA